MSPQDVRSYHHSNKWCNAKILWKISKISQKSKIMANVSNSKHVSRQKFSEAIKYINNGKCLSVKHVSRQKSPGSIMELNDGKCLLYRNQVAGSSNEMLSGWKHLKAAQSISNEPVFISLQIESSSLQLKWHLNASQRHLIQSIARYFVKV